MGQIKVEKNVGGIEGLCVIEPAVHGDARGYFMETYNEKDMKEAGIDIHFVQDNQSMSTKGVLRGLHFQKQYPQCKLVRAVRGTVFDVAVDLRSNSETYGKWYGVTLSAENKKQFLIPEGFAHGFLVLSDEAEFCYKVNDFWHPNDEGGMAWNDPEIGIEWPQLKGEYKGSASAEGYTLEDGTALNLSDKDQKWLGLKDALGEGRPGAELPTNCQRVRQCAQMRHEALRGAVLHAKYHCKREKGRTPLSEPYRYAKAHGALVRSGRKIHPVPAESIRKRGSRKLVF